MLGGISSGTILRGEVTDVYQGGASLKMSFFMNGRLFEGNLSAQQPTVKSSVNHTPSGSLVSMDSTHLCEIHTLSRH